MELSKYLKVTILALLVLCPLVSCYESQEEAVQRYHIYKDFCKFSNNTIRVGITEEQGLNCMANDYIENGQALSKIPAKFGLCPYYLYPFKYEIVRGLLSIPGFNQTIGVEQKLGIYTLVYLILYDNFAPKEQIKEYIKEKRLTHYINYTEVDPVVKATFPKRSIGYGSMDNEHYNLLKSLLYPLEKNHELEGIFNTLNHHLSKNDHSLHIIPWVNSFKNFRWAYGLVMSRAFTVRIPEYNIMIDNKNGISDHATNTQLNKLIGANIGAPCIVSFLDLCNHYQPKYQDTRDRHNIILSSEKGYFVNKAPIVFLPGEEVDFTYSTENSNLMLLLNYGFIIRHNIFNLLRLKLTDDIKLTPQQFNVCRELGCFDATVRDAGSIPKIRHILIKSNIIDYSLLNFGRVRHLPTNFNEKMVVKNLMKDQIISNDNELNAWLFYYKQTSSSFRDDSRSIESSLYKAQEERNKARAIEEKEEIDEESKDRLTSIKTTQIIYEMDYSYKSIVIKHMKVSLNKIITHTQYNLDKLRSQYLS